MAGDYEQPLLPRLCYVITVVFLLCVVFTEEDYFPFPPFFSFLYLADTGVIFCIVLFLRRQHALKLIHVFFSKLTIAYVHE